MDETLANQEITEDTAKSEKPALALNGENLLRREASCGDNGMKNRKRGHTFL